MPKWIILFILILPVLVGCSGGFSSPVGTDADTPVPEVRQALNNHCSWGEYQFHINADRSRVDIVPQRQAQHHFNVKMLLEKGPCYNCIWIISLVNNGDGTINLGVALRHPYPGNDYYTGFDVRGIVHFPANGNITKAEGDVWNRPISLREAGDPELLNADGYNYIYGVYHDGPDWLGPIKNYQPGGNLGGGIGWGYYDYPIPLNAFKYYHSSENRRYFSTSQFLVRDYHIYIPPGEWDFGYSVDACWAPPLKDPVTNVPDDFPLWANCMANYRVDAELVGEIDGDNPATLVVDVYNHAGTDVIDFVIVCSGDLFQTELWYMDTDPIDMGDHLRWLLPVYNLKGAEPGWYRIAVHTRVNPDKWPGPIEGVENIGASVWQVVKVHVVN